MRKFPVPKPKNGQETTLPSFRISTQTANGRKSLERLPRTSGWYQKNTPQSLPCFARILKFPMQKWKCSFGIQVFFVVIGGVFAVLKFFPCSEAGFGGRYILISFLDCRFERGIFGLCA